MRRSLALLLPFPLLVLEKWVTDDLTYLVFLLLLSYLLSCTQTHLLVSSDFPRVIIIQLYNGSSSEITSSIKIVSINALNSSIDFARFLYNCSMSTLVILRGLFRIFGLSTALELSLHIRRFPMTASIPISTRPLKHRLLPSFLSPICSPLNCLLLFQPIATLTARRSCSSRTSSERSPVSPLTRSE